MEEKITFSLTPILTEEKIFEIKDYDTVKEAIDDYVALKTEGVVINDDIDFKNVKADRMEIRKRLKTIKDARLTITKLYMGTFDEQMKALEKVLNDADKELKALVDGYDEQRKGGNVVEAPKVITLTIKGYDLKAIEKLRDAAIKAKLEAVIK